MSMTLDDFAECQADPRLWYVKGLRDPDYVFPKNQAQKVNKPLPRTICSTSLVDQLCTRWFYQEFTDAETYVFPAMDTMKGMGFTDEHATFVGDKVDGNRASFNKISGASVKGPISSDISGWDMNFVGEGTLPTYWVMRQTCVNYDSFAAQFENAYQWWSMSLCSNLYVTADGDVYAFLDNKVQRSGGFLTTTSNGNFRCALAYAVGSIPIANGDDCLEISALDIGDATTVGSLVWKYQQLNVPVRDAVQFGTDYFEFCSHGFTRQPGGGWKAHLSSYERMFYETTISRDIVSSEVNWSKEMENHPDRDLVERFEAYLEFRAKTLASPP